MQHRGVLHPVMSRSYRSSARGASSRNWHGLRSRDPAPRTMLIRDQPNLHWDRRRMGTTWHLPTRASACRLESGALLSRVLKQPDRTWDCVQSWAGKSSLKRRRSHEFRRDRRRRVPWQLRRGCRKTTNWGVSRGGQSPARGDRESAIGDARRPSGSPGGLKSRDLL